MPEKPNAKNIWKHIEITNSCWLWKGSTSDTGYGKLFFQKKQLKAHRFVYELLEGKIPEGLELDHLCRIRNCVNPAHLDITFHKDNVLRGRRNQNYNKTHCNDGHEFTLENTYIFPSGKRRCRICLRENQRKNRRLKQIA